MLIDHVQRLFEQHLRIDLLGIKAKPTLQQAFDILIDRRDSLLRSPRRARHIFAYMNELEGRTAALMNSISTLQFIPVFPSAKDRVHFATPTEVFIRSEESKIDTEGLIDFVDFGADANTFLRSLGVLSFPTTPILAKLLLDRQERYLADTDADQRGMAQKLNVYLQCLKQLATLHSAHNDLIGHAICERLEKERWCLGYQTVRQENGQEERIGQIVRPSDVYLDDDHSLVTDLQPLCAPDEQLVTELYHALGSRWLSESAQRLNFHTGNSIDTSSPTTIPWHSFRTNG